MLGVSSQRWGAIQITAQHRRKQFDTAEGIPNFVGNPPDHLAHGRQPIAALQPVLQFSYSRDILNQYQAPGMASFAVLQGTLGECDGRTLLCSQGIDVAIQLRLLETSG